MTPKAEKPHTGAVTQQDIADYCGICRASVSFALRGDTSHVPPETIKRVQAAAKTLGYSPNSHQAARRLVMQRYGKPVLNRLIAFCLPRTFHQDAYLLEPFLGAVDALTAAKFDLLLIVYESNSPAETLADSQVIARGEVDALIVFTIPHHAALIQQQMQRIPMMRARPFISLISPTDGPCSIVAYHDEESAYAIGRHLVQLGHRDLLILATAYNGQIGLSRQAGLQRALAEAEGASGSVRMLNVGMAWLDAVTPTEALPALEMWDANDQVTEITLPDYLAAHPDITAIVAANDWCAQHLQRILARLGRRVPEEISLVGFDDNDAMRDAAGDEDGHLRILEQHLLQQHHQRDVPDMPARFMPLQNEPIDAEPNLLLGYRSLGSKRERPLARLLHPLNIRLARKTAGKDDDGYLFRQQHLVLRFETRGDGDQVDRERRRQLRDAAIDLGFQQLHRHIAPGQHRKASLFAHRFHQREIADPRHPPGHDRIFYPEKLRSRFCQLFK